MKISLPGFIKGLLDSRQFGILFLGFAFMLFVGYSQKLGIEIPQDLQFEMLKWIGLGTGVGVGGRALGDVGKEGKKIMLEIAKLEHANKPPLG